MPILEFNHYELVDKYGDCRYHYIPDQGYIIWRLGTGDNTELLHIRTFEKGQGYGRKLVYMMLDRLKWNPPYHSIFGFTRVSNVEAQNFYGALGFELQETKGVYADGRAILFWQSYEELLKRRDEYVSQHRLQPPQSASENSG